MNESQLLLISNAKKKKADGNNNPMNKLMDNKTSEKVGKTKYPSCDLTNNDAAAISTFVYNSIHTS